MAVELKRPGVINVHSLIIEEPQGVLDFDITPLVLRPDLQIMNSYLEQRLLIKDEFLIEDTVASVMALKYFWPERFAELAQPYWEEASTRLDVITKTGKYIDFLNIAEDLMIIFGARMEEKIANFPNLKERVGWDAKNVNYDFNSVSEILVYLAEPALLYPGEMDFSHSYEKLRKILEKKNEKSSMEEDIRNYFNFKLAFPGKSIEMPWLSDLEAVKDMIINVRNENDCRVLARVITLCKFAYSSILKMGKDGLEIYAAPKVEGLPHERSF